MIWDFTDAVFEVSLVIASFLEVFYE